MSAAEKPLGIHSFRTIWFGNEAECRNTADEHPDSVVCEMRRLFDLPSDWILLVKK